MCAGDDMISTGSRHLWMVFYVVNVNPNSSILVVASFGGEIKSKTHSNIELLMRPRRT